mgnify:CR=1 FL=1
MKITKQQLRQIIKEELLKEEPSDDSLTQNDWYNLSNEIDAIVSRYVSFGYNKEAVVAALLQYAGGTK